MNWPVPEGWTVLSESMDRVVLYEPVDEALVQQFTLRQRFSADGTEVQYFNARGEPVETEEQSWGKYKGIQDVITYTQYSTPEQDAEEKIELEGATQLKRTKLHSN